MPPGHGALDWQTPVVVTAHSCVLSWWRAVKGCEAPQCWDRYRAAVTQSLSAADLVTAPSRAMADAVADHQHLDPGLVLAEDGTHGEVQEGGVVVGRDDHGGDRGLAGHVAHPGTEAPP